MTSPYSDTEYDPNNTNNTWYKMISMVPDGSSVLDVGCSSGRLGAVLRTEKQATVTGIDITASDIKAAEKNLDTAFVYDIENQPLNDKRFQKYDVIIFADVLEHMKDPVLVLQKVKQLLKPDGRLIFSIPNMAHMFVRLQLLAGSFRYTETGLLDYTHLHFYDDSEVTRIFTAAHYKIEHYDCTTFDYPNSLLTEKLEAVGLSATKKFLDIAHQKQAIVFEYVGWASPVPATKKLPQQPPIGTSSPLGDVLAYVQRVKDADESKLRQAQDKVRASDAHIKKLEQLVAEQQNKLDEQAKLLSQNPLKRVFKKH